MHVPTDPMPDPRLLLARDGQVATLTLNRAAKLNALDPAMLDQMEQFMREIDADPTARVVLLTGAGEKAFCVGADISAWAALSPLQMWADWVRRGHRVFEQVARLRQPVIAVLNGYTFGGGLELALAADIRLAADHTELAMPEVKLGTVPGWAGTDRLPRLIGVARAKQMIFSGARVSAALAERWGLVNEVVPREQLMARAQALAAEIAANSPVAVQVAKQIIDGSAGLASAATLEGLAAAVTAATKDAAEGLAAYREKRQARFTGFSER
jgi:enoyl-CoA hydratase/carnithine racemase